MMARPDPVTTPPDVIAVGPAAAPGLAALHAEAFATPWDEAAFADLLAQTGVLALGAGADGFILCRIIADEAEVLTLAVRPAARQRGLGRLLVEAALKATADQGAVRLFLEVAEDNPAAIALYDRTGFTQIGRRRGYYARPDGPAVDALVLALDIPARP